MVRHTILAAVILASWLVPAQARSQETGESDVVRPAGATSQDRGQLGMSVNNLGLQTTLERSWSWPLWASRHPLLAGAHLSTGVVNVLAPAYARLGGWLEFSPLSVLDIRTGLEPVAYFGTFNALKSFDDYSDPFDSEALSANTDSRTGHGTRFYVEPVAKGKFGPLVAQVAASFERWQTNASGEYFYEPFKDTLLRSAGDTMVSTTSLAMYQRSVGGDGTVSAGVLHTLNEVFDAPQNRCQRLGVIAIREYSSTHLRVPRMRITVTAWRYLDDPSKKNQFGAAAAVGFRRGR